MKTVALVVLFALCVSCKPKLHCPDVDAGASLPCVGQADGVECCLGSTVGACRSGRCIAP